MLGDSITQGNKDHIGPRYPLWKKMVEAGFQFQWTGSMNEEYQGYRPELHPSLTDPSGNVQDFPRNHEGHWGWTSDQVLSHLPTWKATWTCQPTCVLLYLGNNDMCAQHQEPGAIIQELEDVITFLKSNSSITPEVLLAAPFKGHCPAMASKLVPAIIQHPWSGIHLIRHDVGFDATAGWNGIAPIAGSDTWDGVHPNEAGSSKMAEKWFEGMRQHCSPTSFLQRPRQLRLSRRAF